MTDIVFYDANCQIGRHNYRLEGTPFAVEDLASDMEAQGIARRLVYHSVAKEYSPAVGNQRVLQEVAPYSGLDACWAMGAWVTEEMPRPEELAAAMQAAGVRAARFFTRYHYVPMGEWSLGVLWSELEVHRIPLFLDLGYRWATMDDFDPEPVYQLCHNHPELPVILVKHRMRYNRQPYQLLATCPNLRLELSGQWNYRAVEDVCRRFGPERILFGTNWPYMDSSFAVAAVMYAEISDVERAAVAGGNLQQLLESVQW
jgi:predicted TIM-barrel fold metal-dependent hydrolase